MASCEACKEMEQIVIRQTLRRIAFRWTERRIDGPWHVAIGISTGRLGV